MAKKAEKAENKGGRPTKYKSEYVQIAGELCKQKGYTDKNLAAHFKVSETQLYVWKQKYPEFAEAIKKGKDSHDTEIVESCLLKRAKGYSFEETTKELRKDEEGVEQLVIVKIVTKHMPSSDVSKIFWLKNRNPDRWSDKKEIDHRIEGITKPLTEEELMERLEQVKEAGTGIDKKSIEGNGNGSGSGENANKSP